MQRWQKLNWNFEGWDLERFRGGKTQQFGDTFHEYSLINGPVFRQELAHRVHLPIPPDLVLFTDVTHPGVGVHRDQYPTVINYYITADQDQTVFYHSAPQVWTRVKTHSADGLVKETEFTAQQGDVYLMDVSCLHSVTALQRTRQLLRFVWRQKTFAEIAASLNEI
jgi:predicted GIY-YIG superfamily endonuclease